MIKATVIKIYLCFFVSTAPIQVVDMANCAHFKLNSVVLNMPVQMEDSAIKLNKIFNMYFSFIVLLIKAE